MIDMLLAALEPSSTGYRVKICQFNWFNLSVYFALKWERDREERLTGRRKTEIRGMKQKEREGKGRFLDFKTSFITVHSLSVGEKRERNWEKEREKRKREDLREWSQIRPPFLLGSPKDDTAAMILCSCRSWTLINDYYQKHTLTYHVPLGEVYFWVWTLRSTHTTLDSGL